MKADLQVSKHQSFPSTTRAASTIERRHDMLEPCGDAAGNTWTRLRMDAARARAERELADRVQLFLASSSIPALRHLSVEIDGDTVTLSGAVHSFYERQLATEFTRRVAGVIRVVDLIEVDAYAPRVDAELTDRARFKPSSQD